MDEPGADGIGDGGIPKGGDQQWLYAHSNVTRTIPTVPNPVKS